MIQNALDNLVVKLNDIEGIGLVYSVPPARPQIPSVLVEPNNNWVSVRPDEYDASWGSNWRITVMVKPQDNALEMTNLITTVNAIATGLWEYEDVTNITVDKPFIIDVNGAAVLSTYMNISIDMQGGN